MTDEQNSITEKKTRCIMTGKPEKKKKEICKLYVGRVNIIVHTMHPGAYLFTGKSRNKYWVHLFIRVVIFGALSKLN